MRIIVLVLRISQCACALLLLLLLLLLQAFECRVRTRQPRAFSLRMVDSCAAIVSNDGRSTAYGDLRRVQGLGFRATARVSKHQGAPHSSGAA